MITKVLPALRRRVWLTLVLPLAVALSFLIATGGELQHGATSALRSDAASLYAAANGEGIARFPDLGTWLLWGLDPVPLLVALIIIIASLHARTVLWVSLRIGIGTAVGLTLLDLSSLAFADNGQQSSELRVSIVANLMAGSAVGLIAVPALKLFTNLWRKSTAGVNYLPLFSLLVVLASVATSTALYLTLFFFFHPTAVQLEARLEPPSRGFFVSGRDREAKKFPDSEEPRAFSIIPPETSASGAEATLIDARPTFQWRAPGEGPAYRAKVTVMRDCAPIRPFEQTKDFKPHWTIENARSIDLEVDKGQTYAFINRAGQRNYTVDVRGGALFWLKEKDASAKQLGSVSAYLQPPSRLTVKGGMPLIFFVSVPLVELSKQRRATSEQRIMRMKANGVLLKIKAGGSRKFQNGRLQCKTAAAGSVASIADDDTSLADAAIVGVLVEISQEEVQGALSLPDGGQLMLGGVAGHLEILDPVSPRGSLGTAYGVSFAGNVARAQVDGVEIKVSEEDGFDAFGVFEGHIDASGYRITGTARGLWRNQRRVNPTRWERMPTEIQAALLAAIGICLLAAGNILRKGIPHLKNDEELFLHI